MKFHTKRYDITKVNAEEFNEGVEYEINLKEGYAFSDGSHLEYASDVDDLRDLISDIVEEGKQ